MLRHEEEKRNYSDGALQLEVKNIENDVHVTWEGSFKRSWIQWSARKNQKNEDVNIKQIATT